MKPRHAIRNDKGTSHEYAGCTHLYNQRFAAWHTHTFEKNGHRSKDDRTITLPGGHYCQKKVKIFCFQILWICKDVNVFCVIVVKQRICGSRGADDSIISLIFWDITIKIQKITARVCASELIFSVGLKQSVDL